MFNLLLRAKIVGCSLTTWPKIIVSCRYLTGAETSETVDLHHVSFTSKGQSSTRPPVVILHGLMSSMNAWKKKAQAIHDITGRKVITVDARNHGSSPYSPQHTYIHMAHDTAKLINKLGHPKVSVLGHSMGGRTAMALSLLYPHLISNMIVGDISPGQTIPENRTKLSTLLDAMAAVSDSISMRPGMSEAAARQLADEKLKTVRPDGRARRFILASFGKMDNGQCDWRLNVPSLKENFKYITMFPPELRKLRYQGPVLFVTGSISKYISERDVQVIHELFPAVQWERVDGASHSLPYRNPVEFVRIVCKFIEDKS